jgi:hypothetical protein
MSANLAIETLLSTLRDVFPIAAVILGFQIFVLRKRPARLDRVLTGFALVIAGLTLFLLGLEQALFPLGKLMAQQLTDPSFILSDGDATARWADYLWVYAFAFCIGFSTTIAEPALIAVAIKANEISGGVVGVWGLRIAVALGVAVGITLGVFRIVTGTPLAWYIITGYALVIVQTAFAPKSVVALAYDSGGVTTSTVTVPLVTALGLGLASSVPGRSAVMDGFGLIAFASLFPMLAVMGYAQLGRARQRRADGHNGG